MSARSSRLGLVVLAIIGVTGCAARSVYRPASTTLEQGIVLVEQDERGAMYPIGSSRPDAPRADSVAILEQVDDNSTVHIKVRPSVLAPSGDAGLDTSHIAALVSRAARLRQAVGAMGSYLQLRAEALRQWDVYTRAPEGPAGETARSTFIKARRAYGASEGRQMGLLRGAFVGTSEESRVDSLVGHLETDAGPLTEYLRSRVEQLDGEVGRLRQQVGSSEYHLRLEAFLVTRGDGRRTAIHLEGYDDIAAGEVQRHDPAGLDLTAQEREALRHLAGSSEALAKALEQLRIGQGQLEDVLSAVAPQATKQLVLIGQVADSLRLQADVTHLEQRAARLRAAGQLLERGVVQAAGNAAASQIGAIVAGAEAGVREKLASHANWVELVTLASDLRTLRAPGATAVDLADWVTRIAPVVNGIEKPAQVVEELEQDLGAVLSDAEARMRELPIGFKAIVAQKWEASALRQELQSTRDLAARALWVADQLHELRGQFGRRPDLAPVIGGERFDVPLDQLKDTALEVQRTPRSAGDEFEVKSTLLRDGAPIQSSMTVLRVNRFGRRGVLRPGVVVATPDRFAGDSDMRRYTTSLSYLWTYIPRPREHSLLAGLARALRPEVGPHAIFLNFEPKDQRDFGFGLTLGLFEGVAQGGIGWNPFVSRADAGQNYYFFGSNLFGLLHDIGLTEVEKKN